MKKIQDQISEIASITTPQDFGTAVRALNLHFADDESKRGLFAFNQAILEENTSKPLLVISGLPDSNVAMAARLVIGVDDDGSVAFIESLGSKTIIWPSLERSGEDLEEVAQIVALALAPRVTDEAARFVVICGNGWVPLTPEQENRAIRVSLLSAGDTSVHPVS